MKLKRFNNYRFIHTPEPKLIYVGKENGWHQFVKAEDGRFGNVWSELLDDDLELIEEVEGE